MKLSHIGDLVHHLLLFLVLQHHHELALVDARDTCKSIKPKKVRQKEKKMGVANVRLANVRYLGVANVRIWERQMSDIWGWQMSAWQMSHNPLILWKSSNFKQISEMWSMLCLSEMQSNNLSLCLSQDKASKELNSPQDKTYSAD